MLKRECWYVAPVPTAPTEGLAGGNCVEFTSCGRNTLRWKSARKSRRLRDVTRTLQTREKFFNSCAKSLTKRLENIFPVVRGGMLGEATLFVTGVHSGVRLGGEAPTAVDGSGFSSVSVPSNQRLEGASPVTSVCNSTITLLSARSDLNRAICDKNESLRNN